jgi:hypothetical protein
VQRVVLPRTGQSAIRTTESNAHLEDQTYSQRLAGTTVEIDTPPGTKLPIRYTLGSQRVSTRMAPTGAYRPRVMTADALSLIKRTVWLVPRTTTWITPEMPYSLL